ncbi:MAG: putative enzyme related to lactoylglutathione lyase [Hyphomicrobiaceae bacterium]|jgi:predicted enzyme related to lactoylglutathione lyase
MEIHMPGHGTFHWNELMTGDVEAAKAFFAETVGWEFDGMPMPEGMYWVAKVDDQPVAGIMAMTDDVPKGVPPHWLPYLEVDDIDVRLAKIKAAGGEVLRDVFEVPQVGRFAILKDSTGAAMGWITPANPQG